MIQIEINGNKRVMNNAINEITVAEFEQLCVILNGDDEDVFDVDANGSPIILVCPALFIMTLSSLPVEVVRCGGLDI